jgi:hypothetical protein
MKAVKARGVVPQAGGSRATRRRMAANFAKLPELLRGIAAARAATLMPW